MSSELMETENASMALETKPTTSVKQPTPPQEVVRGHTFHVSRDKRHIKIYLLFLFR
jgi:hypothetical protein